MARYFIRKKKTTNECDVATPLNTPGVGNAVPPSETSLGSGDKWDNIIMPTKKKKES